MNREKRICWQFNGLSPAPQGSIVGCQYCDVSLCDLTRLESHGVLSGHFSGTRTHTNVESGLLEVCASLALAALAMQNYLVQFRKVIFNWHPKSARQVDVQFTLRDLQRDRKRQPTPEERQRFPADTK